MEPNTVMVDFIRYLMDAGLGREGGSFSKTRRADHIIYLGKEWTLHNRFKDTKNERRKINGIARRK